MQAVNSRLSFKSPLKVKAYENVFKRIHQSSPRATSFEPTFISNIIKFFLLSKTSIKNRTRAIPHVRQKPTAFHFFPTEILLFFILFHSIPFIHWRTKRLLSSINLSSFPIDKCWDSEADAVKNWFPWTETMRCGCGCLSIVSPRFFSFLTSVLEQKNRS